MGSVREAGDSEDLPGLDKATFTKESPSPWVVIAWSEAGQTEPFPKQLAITSVKGHWDPLAALALVVVVVSQYSQAKKPTVARWKDAYNG